MIEVGVVQRAARECSLDDHELVDRTEEWRRIAMRAESRRTEEGRVVATYPKDDALLRDIRRLIAAEAECCPSMRFAVEELPDRVVVELAVPTD